MKQFHKDIIDFVLEEAAKGAQLVLTAIGVGGAFVVYAVYLGG